MERIRQFLETTAGKATAGGAIVLALVVMWMSYRSAFGPTAAGRASSERMFICAKTGKPFEYTLKAGDSLPVKSPHSGDNSGYPAEACSWKADGGIRPEPVFVLLNSHKGDNSPTFCPDCGRLVVGHNPKAAPGKTPPPKKEEYKPRRTDRE